MCYLEQGYSRERIYHTHPVDASELVMEGEPRDGSHKESIHRLAYRFSINFSFLGLAYRCLFSESTRFLFGNHNTKV
jgi:hypothetical protein